MTENDISPSVKQHQIRRIVEYLKTHDGITSYEAITQISVARLASRICDMKNMGYNISCKWVSGKNKYGEKWRAKKYWITMEG